MQLYNELCNIFQFAVLVNPPAPLVLGIVIQAQDVENLSFIRTRGWKGDRGVDVPVF